MMIKDKITKTFDGYELETDRIDTSCSLERDMVVLRYNGSLPGGVACNDAAEIVFLIRPHRQRVILKVDGNRYALSASPDEICHILAKFFFSNNSGNFETRLNTGLSDYYLGFWQALFVEYAERFHSNLPLQFENSR